MSQLLEAIEKAMEGVTPGPWQTVQTRKDIQRLTVAGPSEIVCGLDGICEPDRMNDRLFAEDAANMRYIAACNPVAMSAILAEVRKAEALKREIADLRNALRKLLRTAEYELYDASHALGVYEARALLSKESAEQDGSASSSIGGEE